MSCRYLPFIVTLLLASAVGVEAAEPASAAKPSSAKVEYDRDIRPLLAEHCLQCHGPDKAEAGLNLTQRSTAMLKLSSGVAAIVPGQPAESELLKRIESPHADERMPPEKPALKAPQIALLRQWIASGAEYQSHWAFQPLSLPVSPAVHDTTWVRNPIDRFVLARLEAAKIKPSPLADRVTLIKRLHYDLIGLPPTPAEVDQFVHDPSPGAYEALIDRLLASKHFGERWGRHWLDMARYADSDGYEKDRARPDAFVYRDWVIDAFNEDLPFDQFTIQQIAGDLLPRPSRDQLVATAFNRQTLTNEEGGVDQEEFRINAVFDRTETLGAVWLGLTVGCARCHNHKYDPISQREYYQLFAYFNAADEVNVKLPVKATNLDEYLARSASVQAALAARKKQLAPQQAAWEDEQREILGKTKGSALATKPLEIEQLTSTGATTFNKQTDGSYRAQASTQQPNKAGETYTLRLGKLPELLTGLRIEAIRDETLPNKGPGRSSGGNFVVNRVQLQVVDSAGKSLRTLPLARDRVTATFEQTNFKAVDVLNETIDPKRGWAIQGKTGEDQHLQLRTIEPVTLADGERLQLTIDQHYGSDHALGRLRVTALTGDARGLRFPANIVQALDMYPEKRVAATRQALFDYYASQDDEIRRLDAELSKLQQQYQVESMQVRTLANSLRGRKTYRFERGEFLNKAEEVQSGTFGILPAIKPLGQQPTRYDLAQWLVSERNPLSPRVAANHVWAHLFGEGLVRTVNDFGVRGETPSHPELLDWLASTYRDKLGWSTKRLIKTILLSATYQQSSVHRGELVEVDPLNTLLHRQNRLRVEGEIVRDLALAAGGLLSTKVGGASVFPPMPADLAKLSYANNFSWSESKGEDRYRRGMYTFFKRTIPHPTLMTFDCPDSNTACVDRTVSNTPLQALALLNNESFVEAAQGLTQRLLAESAATDAQRLTQAWRWCLVRQPSEAEQQRYLGLLQQARAYFATHVDEARQLAGKTKSAQSESERAAWVATARMILNLDEFITRE